MESIAERGLERLDLARTEAGLAALDDVARARLRPVFAASEFAAATLCDDPRLVEVALGPWLGPPAPPLSRWVHEWPAPDDDTAMRALRRFRRAESTRLVLRDLLGIDDVPATLAGSTALAEACIELALAHLEPAFYARHGTPRLPDGSIQRLVVIGMGKLGGGELNFSSDIDLVFAYAEAGQCEGGRALEFEDFYARLGQRLAQLLGEVTADGFCHRVDLRLRPFGSVGRMALCFAAMEHYYQREGRDWERYAWIKARPVAGDVDGGRRLLAQLAPFVYRRYLDFTAIDGLREMKRLIDAEVARKDLADHIKLGPGGIRELEFMVQLVQLVRGGREPSLRTPSYYAAHDAAVALGHAPVELAAQLREAYDFLRRVENRLQMWRDEQTHELPTGSAARAALARGLGYADWSALAADLARRRSLVAGTFAELLSQGAAPASAAACDWSAAWRAIGEAGAALPAPYGTQATEALAAYARGSARRGLDERSRARLDRLLPDFLAACAGAAAPDDALARVLRLLQAVSGRATYLALLDERPAARARVVETFARSAWLAERVVAHPLLLDDLLDARVAGPLPHADALRARMLAVVAEQATGDVEDQLERIHELRHSALFRLALAWLARRLSAGELAARLAGVAEATVAAITEMALADTRRAHGALVDAGHGDGFAVIGYGSLGGAELGFGSDLDLVFVYDGAAAKRVSQGARAIEGQRWYARVAQRVVHWLTTPMRAGTLYAVDTRLRPDGAKGLLVVSLDGFAEYQRERAWTWEHQALVRARAVAGDAAIAAAFEAIRAEILARRRGRAELAAEVVRMRERWRAELDRSDGARMDLKQGRGGSVDLEFLLQFEVLAGAAAAPGLAGPTRTPDLLDALARTGALDAATAQTLHAAHAALLERGLDCTLDGQPRLVPRDTVAVASQMIASAWSAHLALFASH
jgi:glutamate-ammonia-ligase adenylyltransferase